VSFCILAIDPGLSGAIAIYFPTAPERVVAEDVPVVDGAIDGATLAARIEQFKPDVAIIERVAAMPKQGVSSTFTFGRSFGTVIGVVQALRIPQHMVTPGMWKKHFRLSADKEEARAHALQLFPAVAAQFSRKKDHGRAEAALIARYWAERSAA